MFAALHTLENLILPAEAYERAGGKLAGDLEQLSGKCPYCSHDIWFTRNSWLCCNDSCPALTGGSLEIALGQLRQSGAYTLEGAFDWMLRTWQARCRDTLVLQGEHGKTHATRGYRLRRELIRWVRGLKQDTAMTAPKSLLMESLGSMGLQRPDTHVFHPAAPDDLAQLAVILGKFAMEMPKVPRGKTLLVIPYGPVVHEISMLTLMDVHSKWQHQIVLHDTAVVFSGLWHLSHRTARTFVCQDPVTACQLNQRLHLEGADVAIACAFGSAGAREAQAELPDPIFTLDERKARDITAALRFTELYPVARVQQGYRGKPVSRTDFCLQALQPHIDARTGAATGAGVMLLGLMHPQGVERADLLNALRARGWHGAWRQVNHERYVVDLIKTDKGTLVNTPEGYAVRRKAGHLDNVSNFTVQFQDTITFEEQLPYYRVSVFFGTHHLKTIIPSRMLDAPKELTEHLQMLATMQNLTDMPYVQDGGVFKQLSHYWRALLPKLEVQKGMAYIGWDSRFTTFQLPGCQITPDGTFYRDLPLHPDIIQLDCFKGSSIPGIPQVDLDLPVELRTLVLMILGIHIQVFRRSRVRPVQIRHDSNTMHVLERVFRGLGQVRPIGRLQNRLPGMQAMPAYALSNQREYGSITEPFFVLTELGTPITGSFEDTTLDRAAQVLRRLMIQTTEMLLGSAEPRKWTRPASVLWSNELILTAQNFLAENDITFEGELKRFEFVEKLLRQVPKERVADYFSYDFQAQTVTLSAQDFVDSIDMFRLECELRSIADNVRVQPGYQVNLDAYSAITLLQQYYGELPDLKPLSQ